MRRLAGVLAGLTLCAIGAPEARAAGTCVYDAATKTVTATAQSPSIFMAQFTINAADAMTFDGAPCGDATTANTTAVNINGSGRPVQVNVGSPVTTTVITVTNSSLPTTVQDAAGAANDWAGGRLADGRAVADLDGDGAAELVTSSLYLVLFGLWGNDTLSGAGGFTAPNGEVAGPVNNSSSLIGGSGDDHITGPGRVRSDVGNDTIVNGSSGITWLVYFDASQALLMEPDLSGTEPGGDGYGTTDTYIGFTASTRRFDVLGTPQADLIYGGPGNDELEGNPGNDQLFGGGGNDTVSGNAGADTVEGGPGNDTVIANAFNNPGSSAGEILRGGAGADVVQGGPSDDDFGPSDDEADTITCYGGADTGQADRVDTLSECEFAAPVVSFAPASASVDEGGVIQLTLTLSYALAFPAAVDVLTVDDTAKSDSDYAPVARRITFAAGETTATVDVSAPADDQDEPAETFTVSLADPSNAPALGPDAVVTVNDENAIVTTVALGPEPATGEGGTYLAPPTLVVTPPASATETRCVLDPATVPATFGDIPAGSCPYVGAGQKVTADGAHRLCAASTSATSGDTTAVACAAWSTDATAPTVTCATASFKAGEAGRTVTATVTDATSGPVAGTLAAPADTATSGEKAVTFVGRDKAGNATTVACAYSVSSVALCGQPLVLLTVQLVGRRVDLGGLAAPAYAGQTVTITAGGRRVGTARVAGDGTFSLRAKAPRASRRATIRYRATLPDGSRTHALKLSRSLVITRRSGNTVYGRIVAPKGKRPKRVALYRQNTCTSQRVFARAKVSRSGTFKVRLSGPAAPERIALYRVIAALGKGATYTLPIVVRT